MRHVGDILFVLVLFFVFAASSLLVILLGARVYRSVTADMNTTYNRLTSLSYITEKIRGTDVDDVRVDAVGDFTALVLMDREGEDLLETWIYADEDALREVLVRQDTGVLPGDGQAIMQLSSFSLEWKATGLLRLEITDTGGHAADVLLSVRD